MALQDGENKCSSGMIFRLLFYDKIFLYAKNLDQTKYQRLLKTFRPISKEAGYDVVEASPDEIVPVSGIDWGNQKLVIFDDFVSEKNQKPLVDYFIQGRHKNCSVIYLSQSYFGTPKDIRLNCSHFASLNFPAAKKSLRSAGKIMSAKKIIGKQRSNPSLSCIWISQENSLRRILMKRFKMSYSNGLLSESTSSQGGKDGKDGLPGVGFKLTSVGDFDLQNKRLTNVAEGTENRILSPNIKLTRLKFNSRQILFRLMVPRI